MDRFRRIGETCAQLILDGPTHGTGGKALECHVGEENKKGDNGWRDLNYLMRSANWAEWCELIM